MKLPSWRPSLPWIPRRMIYLCLISAGVLAALNLYDERGVIEPDFLKDQATMMVMRPLEIARRRLLAVHMPGLFPLRLTCLFTSDDKKWLSVLPGDELVTGKEPGTLRCTNGDSFYVEGETTLRIWSRSGDRTRLEVNGGLVTAHLGSRPNIPNLEVVTAGAAAEVDALVPTRLVASAVHGEGFLGCEGGRMDITLSRRMEIPLLLDSKDCRIDVKRKNEPQKYTLTHGERTLVIDLSLPHAYWQPHQAPAAVDLHEKMAPRNRAQIQLSRSDKGLVAASEVEQKNCILNGLTDTGASQELKQVPRLTSPLAIELANLERQPLFLTCEEGGTLHSSNLLAPPPRPTKAATPVFAKPAVAPSTPAVAPVTEKMAPAAPYDPALQPVAPQPGAHKEKPHDP